MYSKIILSTMQPERMMKMSTEAQKKTQRNCMKRIREKCISEGICLHCRKAPVRPGERLCPECAERQSDRSRKRSERLKAAGICLICRKAPAREGKTCCFDCARKCSERYYRKKEAEKK